MAISKDGSNRIQYTSVLYGDRYDKSGVITDVDFAVCDENDVLKQIKMDATALGTNTSLILKAPTTSANQTIEITLPATSSTIGPASDSFTIIQTDSGTSPTADSSTDTLTLTSADGSVLTTGNATTDTVDFKVVPSKIVQTFTSVTSTPYTVVSTDNNLKVNVASAATINLPAVASSTGKQVIITDISGNAGVNNITVDGNASETINGSTTYVLNIDYESITLRCDGSAWYLV